MIMEYFKLVALGMATMLPVANPLTSVTLLLALGANFSREEQRRQVKRTAFYVAAIILVCFYAGNAIIQSFGISIPGLRIAGGLIVAYIGFTMLFPASSPSEAEAQAEMVSKDSTTGPLSVIAAVSRRPRDISFVPLALPGTAGPGTMALIISSAASLHSQGELTPVHHVAAVTIAILLALLCWICLRSAERVMHILGESGVDAISRVMGFQLICMGVQFVINGMFELTKT